jgi:hypothetical protein
MLKCAENRATNRYYTVKVKLLQSLRIVSTTHALLHSAVSPTSFLYSTYHPTYHVLLQRTKEVTKAGKTSWELHNL